MVQALHGIAALSLIPIQKSKENNRTPKEESGMIPININIKAKVSNISLSEIYALLQKFSLKQMEETKFLNFKGFRFEVEVQINAGINYIITEVERLPPNNKQENT